MRRSRAIKKKHAFLDVFLRAAKKYQNDAIFVNIEGFRPCLSKPSYRAPKWAIMVRLMQKERLKSPQKSRIIENQAFWVILAILAKTATWVILASHFRARVDTPTKSPNWGLARINVTEPHTAVVFSDPLLRRDKIRVLGVWYLWGHAALSFCGGVCGGFGGGSGGGRGAGWSCGGLGGTAVVASGIRNLSVL